ncbi:MAG TPA: twin-arginine translocase subunit TatA [Gammaproteobacteria bacterium]|nr:twin-arginine translocase subunit TatA [Gammaproteobacteria bacterium]HAU06719.1 twin-arginine translocase subunit TatA [Gammaproteobacteria bacterium]
MGIGGISIWQLLILLAIVVLLFGTKKLRSLGGDLGSAIKSFKQSVSDGEAEVNKKQDDISLHHEQADNTAQHDKEKNSHHS